MMGVVFMVVNAIYCVAAIDRRSQSNPVCAFG